MSDTINVPGGGNQAPLGPFTKKRLDNGLTVIVKEAHAVPIAAVYFFVNAGSAVEDPRLSGLAHFYEHMFFKGTSRRGVGEMDRVLKEVGGVNNAFTSIENTAYFVMVPVEHLWTAFDLLADAFTDSRFDGEEVDRERRVVLEEIGRKEDRPLERLAHEYLSVIFEGTPYARPILGTAETVGRISREDFVTYRGEFCPANNSVVVVAGDVDTGTVLEEVEKRTAGIREDSGLAGRKPVFRFVPQQEPRDRRVEMDVTQTYLIAGFPNLGRRRMEDMYAVDVASTVLGDGRSSRLTQRLREREGKAMVVEAFAGAFAEGGYLAVEAVCAPENEQEVLEGIFEEVEKLGREPVGKDELERARTMLSSGFAFEHETVSALARTLGGFEVTTCAEDAIEYVDRVRAVEAKRLSEVVQETCSRERATVVRVVPGQRAAGSKS